MQMGIFVAEMPVKSPSACVGVYELESCTLSAYLDWAVYWSKPSPPQSHPDWDTGIP